MKTPKYVFYDWVWRDDNKTLPKGYATMTLFFKCNVLYAGIPPLKEDKK